MADQATMKRFNGACRRRGRAPVLRLSARRDSPAPIRTIRAMPAWSTTVAGFGENLLTLAELQARLTAIELRQNLDSVKLGGAVVAGRFDLDRRRLAGVDGRCCRAPGFGAGDETGLCVPEHRRRGHGRSPARVSRSPAAGCVRKPFGFPVASEEFARNLNWLRTILRHSGRWP